MNNFVLDQHLGKTLVIDCATPGDVINVNIDSATLVKDAAGVISVDSAAMISADANNSIIVGTDGKLYSSAVAMINDDQVLTGDNTGSATVTMTPTTVADPSNPAASQVNYTVKVDVKKDPAADNQVSISTAGVYVPKGAGLTVTDTTTVDLTLASGDLSADVKISPTAGNLLKTDAGGLLVAPAGKVTLTGLCGETLDFAVAFTA